LVIELSALFGVSCALMASDSIFMSLALVVFLFATTHLLFPKMAAVLDLAALSQRLTARMGPPDDSDDRTPPSSPDLPQDFFQRLPRQVRRRLYYAKTLAAQGRAPPGGSGYTTPSEPDEPLKSKQLFDMYLVLDIEGTCVKGGDYNWPNEIIARVASVVLLCLC
jgi:hypothetical protein